MSKKALIIQHVLPKFQKRADGTSAFDPGEYIPKIMHWIGECSPDRVIVTREYSDDSLYQELEAIGELCEWRWEPWSYGSQLCEMATKLGVAEDKLMVSWAHGEGYCSIVYDWIESLDGYSVIVMGGFKDECLQGLLDTLEHLNTRETNPLDIMYEPHCDMLYPRDSG